MVGDVFTPNVFFLITAVFHLFKNFLECNFREVILVVDKLD